MWISQATFAALMKERFEAQGVAQALERQVATQNITLDWFKAQLTKSEYERAALIQNYMGVKVPVMEFQDTKLAEKPVISTEDILGATVNFGDVGDEEARRMGLDWDNEGRLLANGKLVQG